MLTNLIQRILGLQTLHQKIEELTNKVSELETKTTSDILDYDFRELKSAVLDDIDSDDIANNIDWSNVCYQNDILTSSDFDSHFDDALTNAMDTIKEEVESNLEIPEAKVENLEEIVSKAVRDEIAKLTFITTAQIEKQG